MRDTRFSGDITGEAKILPPMAGHFFEPEDTGLSEADLKLIDSFAGLGKPRQKAVLEKTKQMLRSEMQKPRRCE